MRIAFVVHEYGRTFGHSRYVWELATRYRRAHDVHVFAHRFHEASASGLTFHRVPALRRGGLATILSFLPGAWWHLRRGEFDVVHAQGLTTTRCNVITAHICLAAWFEARRTETVGGGWRQGLFERLVTPMEAAFYRSTPDAWTIAISDATRADLARHYGRRTRVEVIHHGVDLVGFSPAVRDGERAAVRADIGLRAGEVAALFVGDLRRGAAAAIDAVARVPELQLLLVSRSDTTPFREHARRRGVQERVRFLPATPHIERMYAAADAFVFPTPYDAFGMVIAEAMAMGLPVVTTRRAGASELVDDGVTGLLVDDAGDVEGLARHLAALARDPERRRLIGEAARARMERHSWDEVARRTMAVYERTVRERSAAARADAA